MTTAAEASNLVHLAQLEGDARDVATEACRRFSAFVITSSKRDVQRQAVNMARNVVRQRTWIAETYKPSHAAQLCHAWATDHDNAGAQVHEIAAAFATLLNGLPTSELVKLSRHLAPYSQGAHAFDAQPLLTERGARTAKRIAAGELPRTTPVEYTDEGKAICAFLEAKALELGGRFLPIEGLLVINHWQARD